MDVAPLALEHQSLLQARLRGSGCRLSEYSFANLFVFRRVHHYEVIREGAAVWIRGRTYDRRRFLMPTVDVRTLPGDELARWAAAADFLFPIPDEWLAHFDPGRFTATHAEADSDYLYTVEKINTLVGRRLSGKRNLLKQLLRDHDPRGYPLTPDRMGDAIAIVERWQADSGQPPDETDYEPTLEALRLSDELAICGGIYYVDGDPAGFLLGEELAGKVFALQFAKGVRGYKGLYEYMYSTFAGFLPQYRCLNFEQDLGKQALRIAKRSYEPDGLLAKHRVSLRGQAVVSFPVAEGPRPLS